MKIRELARDAALTIPSVRALHAHASSLAHERDQVAVERDRLRLQLEAAHAEQQRLRRELEEASRAQDGLREALDAAAGRERLLRVELEERRTEAGRLRAAEQKAEAAEALMRQAQRALSEADGRPDDQERRRLAAARDELELKLYVLTSDHQRAVALNDDLLDELRAAQGRTDVQSDLAAAIR